MDKIITSGDQVAFLPLFKGIIVAVKPGIIKGSGKTKINGKNVCVKGDETKVKIEGCAYVKVPFLNGVGTLTIQELTSDQVAKNCTSTKKPMILKGSNFKAKFTVEIPAVNPSNGQPEHKKNDAFEGKGYFLSTNTKIKAQSGK